MKNTNESPWGNEITKDTNEYEEKAYDILIDDPKTGQPITVAFHREEFVEILEEKQSLLLWETLIRLDDKRSVVVPYSQILVEN